MAKQVRRRFVMMGDDLDRKPQFLAMRQALNLPVKTLAGALWLLWRWAQSQDPIGYLAGGEWEADTVSDTAGLGRALVACGWAQEGANGGLLLSNMDSWNDFSRQAHRVRAANSRENKRFTAPDEIVRDSALACATVRDSALACATVRNGAPTAHLEEEEEREEERELKEEEGAEPQKAQPLRVCAESTDRSKLPRGTRRLRTASARAESLTAGELAILDDWVARWGTAGLVPPIRNPRGKWLLAAFADAVDDPERLACLVDPGPVFAALEANLDFYNSDQRSWFTLPQLFKGRSGSDWFANVLDGTWLWAGAKTHQSVRGPTKGAGF